MTRQDPEGSSRSSQRSAEPAGRGVSPGVVILAVAMVGSIGYLIYAVTVRDPSQIPLLASGAVVLGLVFAALAVYSLRATWRAGLLERNGRAVVLGLLGGVAAMISAGCFALAIIGFMLRQTPS
jgi:hypothetical protein